MTELPRYHLIINGEAADPASGCYEDVINPATGRASSIQRIMVGPES